jgi:hypothetical protein
MFRSDWTAVTPLIRGLVSANGHPVMLNEMYVTQPTLPMYIQSIGNLLIKWILVRLLLILFLCTERSVYFRNIATGEGCRAISRAT